MQSFMVLLTMFVRIMMVKSTNTVPKEISEHEAEDDRNEYINVEAHNN